MSGDGAGLGKVPRPQADRNRRKFSLPGFLEKPPAPPVNRASPDDMLDRAHGNAPVIQARDTVARQLPSQNQGIALFQGVRRYLAGAGGIEPPNGGIKIRCLTAWLRPKALRKNPKRQAPLRSYAYSRNA